MIIGIGTDIIEIARIASAIGKKYFLQRVYTEKEMAMIGGRAARAAGNFAVKEAVVKAFGTGFGRIAPEQIEVLRQESGKPYIVLYGEAQAQAKSLGITKWHVSISNEKEYAVAYVIAEKE